MLTDKGLVMAWTWLMLTDKGLVMAWTHQSLLDKGLVMQMKIPIFVGKDLMSQEPTLIRNWIGAQQKSVGMSLAPWICVGMGNLAGELVQTAARAMNLRNKMILMAMKKEMINI